MHKKGLTLLEILVSVLILAITITGLAGIFISVKRYILHSRARMSGGELGKTFLEPLHSQVRQDLWGQYGQCLSSTPTSGCLGSSVLDGITYAPTYNITSTAGTLRKVKLTLKWNETSP